MGMFQFARLQNIEEHNFHNVLEDFYKMGIRGLVRENLQNSLDARLSKDQPVVVKITFGDLAVNDIPGIDELKDRVQCLEGKNQYSQATIKRMQEAMKAEVVQFISFEDCNTKGLRGAKNGQSNNPEDTFGVYAYSKGVHGVEDDPEKEKVRGGSHGIGKIASNSASDIYLMYFANCDEHGEQHIGGTIQLIEHQYQQAYYRATGYFAQAKTYGDDQVQKFPYENNFHHVFAKDTRGLKIIVPFLREGFADEVEMVKTICDSFLIAILEKKLVVEINDKVIDDKTIHMYLSDEQYYQNEISEMKKEFTPLYAQTYTKIPAQKIQISNSETTFNFDLYFTYDEKIPVGRMAIFRTVGMKISDYKVLNNVRKPFNAVLIGGADEDVYLKSLENESHTDISADHIKDAKTKRLARKFLAKLNSELDRIIKEEIKKQNPVDGIIDTSDILYTTEIQFKKQIEKALGTVTINTGKKMMKTNDASAPKKQTKKGGKNKKAPALQKKPNPPKPNLTERDDELKKDRYSVQPNLVKRLIVNGKEIIHFDFSQEKAMQSAANCDILFEIIDGMGAKYAFDLANNYLEILNRHTFSTYAFDGNKIKGVTIPKNGIVELIVTFKPTYNKALKFNYLVEV